MNSKLPENHPMHPEIIFTKVPRCVKEKFLFKLSQLQQKSFKKVTYGDVIASMLADEFPDLRKLLEDTPYEI